MSSVSPSATSLLQSSTVSAISSVYSSPDFTSLSPSLHANYLLRAIECLPSGYSSLDSSRPWMIYWILHSFRLLEQPLIESLADRVFDFLHSCWNSEFGGFGGGPNQFPHLAPTFAAVNSFIILSRVSASLETRCFSALNSLRPGIYQFLLSLKDKKSGAFRVCRDGEIDTRGAYTALAVASMLNMLTKELRAGLSDWLLSCHRYEGGFGGEPGAECHGGYTYCGFASLIILGDSHRIDLSRLLKWSAERQMSVEGGFQGRNNKLVDGCYSFWVGALFPLIEISIEINGLTKPKEKNQLFDRSMLKKYLIQCCQHKSGGLKDKPGKGPDLYHTCYCLSGLAIADSGLISLNPIYNLPVDECSNALEFFANKPFDEKKSNNSS